MCVWGGGGRGVTGVRGQCECRHHCAYHSKRHIFGKNDATDNVAEAKADVGLYDHVTSKLQQSAKMTMTSCCVTTWKTLPQLHEAFWSIPMITLTQQ